MRSPRIKLLDPRFRYVPALETDVARTWKRFGFDASANARRRLADDERGAMASGTPAARWGADRLTPPAK